MIEAKELKNLIRHKVNDYNEVAFSDYDLKNALNEALRYISQSQAMQNSDYLETFKIYDTRHYGHHFHACIHGVNLPDDFCTLAGVTDLDGRDLRPVDVTKKPKPIEYKIMGDKIYAGVPVFKLTYKKSIKEIDDINEDVIELPSFCLDLIVKTTVMILNNAETDLMLQQIESLTRSIIPRRRYNNAEIKMPFYC